METVKKEIEELHAFFVKWFTGNIAESEFDGEFLKRFDPDLKMIGRIPPNLAECSVEKVAINAVLAGCCSS